MSENRWQAAADAIEALPEALRAARARGGFSERKAAKEIGVGNGTLHNAERGKPMHSGQLLLILKWLAGRGQ